MATQVIKKFNQKPIILSSLVLLTAASLLLSACGKKADDANHQMPAMPVSVITAEATTVPISIETVAQTEGAKDIEVRPRVGGIVLKKLFEEGQPVKAGQAMFLIDPAPFQIALSQAKAQLAQQQAKIDQTAREASRLKNLVATQSVSQRDYDNAVSDNQIAIADLAQMQAGVRQAELNLSYTNVNAPNSGIAGRFELSEGALVEANSSLLTTITQVSPIWVRFSLSDSDLASLGGKLSESSAKAVNLILANGKEYAELGKLNFVSSNIDPTLGTQQLRAVFNNADRQLLPGQFARVRVTTGERSGVFLVPQTAVLTGDQGKFLYVAEKNKEGKTAASIRPVQAGSWQGADWVILGGLKQGDKVIVDNLIKIRPGAEVAPHAVGEMPAMPASK